MLRRSLDWLLLVSLSGYSSGRMLLLVPDLINFKELTLSANGFMVDKSNRRYMAIGVQLDPRDDSLQAIDDRDAENGPWFHVVSCL